MCTKLGQVSSKKVAKFSAGVILGLGVLGGIAYGADYVTSQGEVPRGTTVGGIAIGGMAKEDAISTLQKQLKLTDQVTVTAGERTATFSPEAAGLSVDWNETIRAAGKQSANPITRLSSFFTTHEVEIVSERDDSKLIPELERVQKELSPAPADAAIRLTDGKVEVIPAVNGQELDKKELDKAVVSSWLHPEGVSVDPKVTRPRIGESAVEEARPAAEAAVSSPIVAHGRDKIDGVIEPTRMGEVVTFEPDGKKFRVAVNTDAARAILNETLNVTEVQRRNADIQFSGSAKTVIPHMDGVRIEWDKTLEHFDKRVTGKDSRTFDVAYTDEPATFTTEQAEAATFDQVVGEFTTGGYSQASGINIARVAQMVNGAIVAPGDTFSLNGYTGPRGIAQGFVESGIILNGHADKAVGGGISQFATTLYNAAYFAGMEDVAHTPHSYYISRYPAGREATVFEGAIDLQFKNTSPYPVRIVTSAGGGSVTVQLTGVKTVNVESVNGGRWNYTPPRPITLSGPDCAASSGAQGFTTSDTRIIRSLSGSEISRETKTTVYDPSPIVTCS